MADDAARLARLRGRLATNAGARLRAGVFEAIVADLRAVLRLALGREPEPSAAIFDSRTLQSTPESGSRAGYDGAKRRTGSKTHIAVDRPRTLAHAACHGGL